MNYKTEFVQPKSFEAENHFYPKALNATIHPMVNFFLNLSKDRIINRYCHLNPMVNKEKLAEVLDYKCKYFLWGGADLINSTKAGGDRQMVIIENNSCPSGHKSMPLQDDHQESGSYLHLIERTFRRMLRPRQGVTEIAGKLGMVYDKNFMEVSGYAAVMADVFEEEVLMVPYFNGEDNAHVKFENGIMYVYHENEWHTMRAVFRYLTQKPWTRLPLVSKTRIMNPIISSLLTSQIVSGVLIFSPNSLISVL